MPDIPGLTQAEVSERRRQGLGNDVKLATSRSVSDIVRTNVFSAVNVVLYAIGAGMWLAGDPRSALATVGLVVFNAAVGIIQETRAKRQLDQIALLARAKVAVRREGAESAIDPSELVQGDVLVIRAGDQIPVDAKLVGSGKLEVDESALTGESDLIEKAGGDALLSGSFAVTGEALAEATAVGEASFANKLTRDARKFKLELTPLQRDVNSLLHVLLLIVIFFGFLATLGRVVLDIPVTAWLQILAVVTGSVSAGLLTLITLNYSWGALRIGQQGGLVQQINAIESLSNVTVLCTDKTGTLTANRIRYHDVHQAGGDRADLERRLADFAASASATNKTGEAIAEGLPGRKQAPSDEVPFASVRKWSALAFDGAGTHDGTGDGDPSGTNRPLTASDASGSGDRPPLSGVYVLGAAEMLADVLPLDEAARTRLQAWSDEGLRVLAFGHNPEVTRLHDAEGRPSLPPLQLLGLVAFSDELRPNLRETLEAFRQNGVRLKVISGDNPQTVAALARQAGMTGDLTAVSGPELAEMTPGQLAEAASSATIFGRITPQQKEALVLALRDQGEYVAMIGDGVNDVLSLKKANLGIAMEGGSSAARSVAAILLLGDSFEVMPAAFVEGQRIVNSIQDILKLFMATVFALLLLIIGVTMLGLGFPFTTLQSTLVSFFARGAPPLMLAVVASAGRSAKGLVDNLLHFTLPASLSLFVFGLLIYMGVFFAARHQVSGMTVTPDMVANLDRYIAADTSAMTDDELRGAVTVLAAQSALTTFFVLAGIMLMLFAAPPVTWLTGGAPLRRGWQVPAAAAALVIGYGLVLAIEPLRVFFQVIPIPAPLNLVLVGLTLVWAVVQLVAWRGNWLERFLDLAGASATGEAVG